jgi:hypothetical protein
MTEEERERVYLRIELANFPRSRGEGATAAAEEIASAVTPTALGLA